MYSECTIAIGGYAIYKLRFADDIDLMKGANTELQDLTNKICKCSATYGMEVSYEKSNILVNEFENNES